MEIEIAEVDVAAMVEQERLDHAHGLRAAETELERLQDQVWCLSIAECRLLICRKLAGLLPSSLPDC